MHVVEFHQYGIIKLSWSTVFIGGKDGEVKDSIDLNFTYGKLK